MRNLLARSVLILLAALTPVHADGVTIAGIVEGSDGRALADVPVALLAIVDPLVAALEPGDDASEPTASTRTDAEGRFRLTAPRPGLWRVEVRAPGCVPMEVGLRPLLRATELEPLRLVPDPGLTVRAIDPEGRPVPGARVEVRADPPRFGFAAPSWRPALEVATTDDAGTTRLAGSDGRARTVSVLAPGWPVHADSGRRGTGLTVRLSAGTRRTLAVVDVEGAPVAGALIALGDPAQPAGRSGEDGKFDIRLSTAGPTNLTVLSADGRRTSKRLLASDGADGKPLRIELPPRLLVAGRLIDALSRRPVAGGLVWDARDANLSFPTDPAGGFVISGSAGRRLDLRAAAPGYLEAAAGTFQLLDDGRPGPTIAVPPAATVIGRVVDTDRQAVAGAHVSLKERIAPTGGMRIQIGRGSDAPAARSAADGTFRLEGVDPERLWGAAVEAESFATASVELPPLAAHEVRAGITLELERGAALGGRVTDGDGAPLADARVRLEAARPSAGLGVMRVVDGRSAERPPREVTTDRDGRFRIAGLAEGRYDVAVSRHGFARRRLPAVQVGADAAGELGDITLGPGVIVEGFIRDDGGRPVEGVEVHVRDGGPRMMMVLEGARAPESPEPAALSDPTGWFRVADLAPGEPLALAFQRRGYVSETLQHIEVPAEAPLDVVLREASDVAGRVIDAGGESIAGAAVKLQRSVTIELGGNVMRSISLQDTSTDIEGRFVFEDQEPGTVALSAVASGQLEAKLDNVEIPAGEDLVGLEIALDAGALLEGRVLAPDGRPAIGATVAKVAGGDRFEAMMRLDGAVTDGAGYYRLEGLAPGTLSIEAQHSDYARAVRDIELHVGRNTLDLTLAGGVEFTGSVHDADGAPVSAAAIALTPAGRHWGGPQATTSSDGRFTVRGVRDGDYRVRVSAAGYAAADLGRTLSVAGEPLAGVDVTLERGGTIVGRVSGVDERDLGDLVVEAQGGGMPGANSVSVDHRGAFRIEHLAPGAYNVSGRVVASGRQATTRVTVEPGVAETTVELEFGRGLTLSGTARQAGEPIVGATIWAEGLDVAQQGFVETDRAGRFALEGLEPGRYALHLREFSSGLAHDQTVDLATSREIEIDLPSAIVAGRVVDAVDRRALAGVAVALERPSGGAPLPGHAVTTDMEGRFRLSGIAAGDWRLTARRDGYAARSEPIEVRESSGSPELRLELEPTAGLVFEARLSSGAAPDEVLLAVLDGSGAAIVAGGYATGEAGSVRVPSVPQGRWDVVISAAGSATTTVGLEAAGAKSVVTLPPASGLRIEVPELAATGGVASVRLIDDAGRPHRGLGWDGQPRDSWTMVGGTIEISSLPPGRYAVEVGSGGARSFSGEATTAAGTTARLTLE